MVITVNIMMCCCSYVSWRWHTVEHSTTHFCSIHRRGSSLSSGVNFYCSFPSSSLQFMHSGKVMCRMWC